jgi:hypothetical protein
MNSGIINIRETKIRYLKMIFSIKNLKELEQELENIDKNQRPTDCKSEFAAYIKRRNFVLNLIHLKKIHNG